MAGFDKIRFAGWVVMLLAALYLGGCGAYMQSENAREAFNEGEQFADEENYDQAIEKYTRAVALDPGELFVQVIAETPLERVDLIRSGELVDSIPIDGLLEVTLGRKIEDLVSGEYLYVRAVQEDSGAAWSSPIYIE